MNNQTIDHQEKLSFEEIYEKYSLDIRHYAQYTLHLSKADAEDVAGEAFLALFQSWNKMQNKTYASLFAWLRKAARFIAFRKNQKEQRLPSMSLEEIMHLDTGTDMWEDFAVKLGYQEKIQLLKSKLKPEEYQLLEYVAIKCAAPLLIAQKENISIEALYVRWHRLRKKIQMILQKGRN